MGEGAEMVSPVQIAGSFLIVPGHVGGVRTWSKVSHSAAKERMGVRIKG
jgi:hypothetical protein